MTIDLNFIPAFSIEEVILDKDTGAPLSGGQVYFEQDNNPGVLKYVYQISGTSPDYVFVPLPNPMTLSAIGTFEDALGNPVVPYFFPYDSNLDVELYYVRVESAGGVPQFTRTAVPYVNNGGGTTTTAGSFENEISNPQFSQVNFNTSSSTVYNFSAAVLEAVPVAPGWDLVVSSAGAATVTVSQTTPTGSLNVETNPGTLLNIDSSGVSRLRLRQRIYGSPNIWSGGYLAATFLAKQIGGASATVTMYYSQSDGSVTDKVLATGTLNGDGTYDTHPGVLLVPVSDSLQSYPSSYVDIEFDLPINRNIEISSVMLAFTGATSASTIIYNQDSNNRQIDFLYHNAYPIIPIGTIIDFGGVAIPEHYFPCDGTTKNRVTYRKLFEALSFAESVTLNSGPTFTSGTPANYWIGMKIEGTGIPASTTVTGITGTLITMSANATISGASTVRIFAWGNGDGSTTFTLPLLQEHVTAGAYGSLFTAGKNAPGYKGGASEHALTIAEMPLHNHAGSTARSSPTAAGGSVSLYGSSNAPTQNLPVDIVAQGGGTLNVSGVPHTIVQKTALVRKCIRYQ